MKDKSVLLAQVVQLVNQANQLLMAVAEYTGENITIKTPEGKQVVQKYRAEPSDIVTVWRIFPRYYGLNFCCLP